MRQDNSPYVSSDPLTVCDAIALDGGHFDYAMSVKNKGTPVEGESRRLYDESKVRRIDIIGWEFGGFWPVDVAAGAGIGGIRLGPLTVVKEIDAATATLGGLFRGNVPQLEVEIAGFKAGGFAVKYFSISLKEAGISSWRIFSSARLKHFVEVMTFEYRDATILSREQNDKGATGPDRVAQFKRGEIN